jgi:hypothetical protein
LTGADAGANVDRVAAVPLQDDRREGRGRARDPRDRLRRQPEDHEHELGRLDDGALVIRNFVGAAVGRRGYGYLPYDYVRHGVAVDFWSLTKQDRTDTGAFKA